MPYAITPLKCKKKNLHQFPQISMGIKGTTLVNTRNITTTATTAAASTKSEREINKYDRSTWI